MIEHRYKVGEEVEVESLDYPRGWRRAIVMKLAPYRGKPGYYITWKTLPKMPDGISPSTGGWTYEQVMRSVH